MKARFHDHRQQQQRRILSPDHSLLHSTTRTPILPPRISILHYAHRDDDDANVLDSRSITPTNNNNNNNKLGLYDSGSGSRFGSKDYHQHSEMLQVPVAAYLVEQQRQQRPVRWDDRTGSGRFKSHDDDEDLEEGEGRL